MLVLYTVGTSVLFIPVNHSQVQLFCRVHAVAHGFPSSTNASSKGLRHVFWLLRWLRDCRVVRTDMPTLPAATTSPTTTLLLIGQNVPARRCMLATSARLLTCDNPPAHGINGSGFEEAQFEERVLGIIAGHSPSTPLFLYYPMHLVHSPLCVPEGYLEKFSFIKDADDNINHDRQYVAAMVHYLDDVVGNVVQALKDAELWHNTLFVWSSDNGAAVELTTGMKNSYPLRGGYTTNWQASLMLSSKRSVDDSDRF